MMNDFQRAIWVNLNKLTDDNEGFFYIDKERDGCWYRIFSYRLASYTDFLNPSALECRGIMFEITESGNNALPHRLAALPMPKFFNKDENPITMGLDFSNVKQIMLKMDGSLITTYSHNGEVKTKSKGALASDQAVASEQYLDKHVSLQKELADIDKSGFSVCMEYTAPDNRIVIGYEKPGLTILCVRSRTDGSFLSKEQIIALGYVELPKCWVEMLEVDDNPTDFINSITGMSGIEGYVIEVSTGFFIKCKTMEYLTQHRAKDSINSDRRLYEVVLAKATDDLRSLFADDSAAIARITEMEERVECMYNHFADTVDRFYERNKDLERKDYAVKGQLELTKQQFSMAMNKYTGKSVSYTDFMMSRWKLFGISDDTTSDE